MIWVAIVLGIVAIALALWALAASWLVKLSPDNRFEAAVRRRVIVHTRDNYSLAGVLSGLYADGVELEAAVYVRSDEADTPLDGTQLLPWQSIAWVQELREIEEGSDGRTRPAYS